MRPNGVITGYTLYIGHENGAVEVFTTDGESTSYNVTDLQPYELISVRVAASTRIGEGPAVTEEIRTAQARMHACGIAWNKILIDSGILIEHLSSKSML